jgi:ABC-type protease/lipase transport system fused ATPase/permease subunit
MLVGVWPAWRGKVRLDGAALEQWLAEDLGQHIGYLPQGYETQVGEGGAALSGGQRQRIGLARALYGDPFLVVLDEPNSNLDSDGEHALTRAIQGVRERGGIVVVIAHRPSALAGVDHILVLDEGMVRKFGLKEEVLSSVLRPVPAGAVHQPNAARSA